MGLINTKKLSLKKQKNLLLEMIRTDFKLRYHESVLGYLWSILKPLFLFGIIYVVFTKILKIGAGIPNYPVSLLLGIVLWNFFTEATSGALKSIISKGSLIRKIDIPRYLIPIPEIASAFINMLLNLLVVFVFLAFASTEAITLRSFVIFPLLILELIVLATAVGYFLAALYVKFRDISYIYDVIKQALWYSIPILWPITRISDVGIQKLVILNPVTQLIQDARAVLTYSGTPQINDIYGSPFAVLMPLGMAVVALAIGIMYFNKHSDEFAEYI